MQCLSVMTPSALKDRLSLPRGKGLWILAGCVLVSGIGLAVGGWGKADAPRVQFGEGPLRADLTVGAEAPRPAGAAAAAAPVPEESISDDVKSPAEPDAKAAGEGGDARTGRSIAGRKGGLNLDEPRRDANQMLWEMLAAVLVVAVLAMVAFFLIRRFGSKLKITQGRQMKLVETLHVGPRQAVHMLDVQGRRILISATRERIAMLTELSAEPGPPAASRKFPTEGELEQYVAQSREGGRK